MPSTTLLADADAPNYRAAEPRAQERCVDCRFQSDVGMGGPSCRLYQIAGTAFKAWHVCDSYERAVMWSDRRTPAVRFAEPGEKEADGSVWIEILRTGEFHSAYVGGRPVSGPAVVKIDEAVLESVKAGFDAARADGQYALGLPVRLDPTHSDPDGPAVGRGHELRVADGRLLLRVSWDDEIADAIKRRAWSSCSIEMEPPGTMQRKSDGQAISDWCPTGLVITEHPFIHGMAPLAASDLQEIKRMSIKAIRQSLGLAESADDSAVLVTLSELRRKAEASEALSEALSVTTADRDALKAQVEASAKRERERMLDDACAKGRIAVSERDMFARASAVLSDHELEATYPEGRIKIASKVEGQPAPKNDGTVTEASVMAEIRTAAKAYSDAGASPTAAFNRASDEALRDPTKAAALGRGAEA